MSIRFRILLAALVLGFAFGGATAPVYAQEDPDAADAEHAADASDAAPLSEGDRRFVGTWMGPLRVGRTELRVVVHVAAAGDSLTATLDSPDQGATGIPVAQVQVDADTLRLGVPSISGQFAGVLGDSARTLDGQWAQGGSRLPLTLRRSDAAPDVRRPQTPEPPFPYATETVRFTNESAGVTLEGTLSMPRADGPHPAVVLVAGSGAQDRDGTVMGHKPLLVLADTLTRRGVAVLRFDERGVGASGGVHASATTADLADDVRAAVDALAQRDDVDGDRIGIVGHSEGGLIAPRVANATDRVAFVVLLATPALPGRQIILDQIDRMNAAEGVDAPTRAVMRGTQQRFFSALTQDADSSAIARDLRRLMLDVRGIPEDRIDAEIRRLMQPWFRYFIEYDPRPALRDLDVPVLALSGSNDLQVAPDTNLTVLRRALEAGANPPHTLRLLDGLNHLLQPADTGAVSEYAAIETTMAPQALGLIADWIADRIADRGTRE